MTFNPVEVVVAMAHYREWTALAATCFEFEWLYPGVEISVCDDGSGGDWRENYGLTMTRLPIKQHALNPCVPLNAAVRASTKPIVVLTNPGMIPLPGLLEALHAQLTPRTYVAAACLEEITGRWLCHPAVKGGQQGRGPMPVGSGFHFCAMLTRDLFEAAGGFDEDYRDGQAYDDNDFLWRLHRAGAAFAIETEIVVGHRRSSTQWPAGGLERNRDLFMRKWGSQ